MSTETKWVHVGADPVTLDEADEVVRDLSTSGARFTKAQILRTGLALGVKAIKADPTVLLPARGRKKTS